MKYLLLIYHNEMSLTESSAEEQNTLIGEYMAFNGMLQAKGLDFAGDALHPTQSAKTVRVRNGQAVTTDGPFAETKEQLGGYYLVDVETEEEALALAAQIPDARNGSIEVRPIIEFDFGQS